MATNLKLDAGLLDEVLKLSGLKTKKDAVTLAMQEFVAKQKRLKILELEGQIEFDPDYDYKAQRRR